MTLDEARANIGAGVVYRPYPDDTADGKIVRVSDRWVFVRYQGSETPRATSAEQLALLAGADR